MATMTSLLMTYTDAREGRIVGTQRGKQDSFSHPDVNSWKLFLERRVEAKHGKRMAEHLEICPACQQTYSALSPPPYRALGRPVPAGLGVSLEAAQSEAAKLVD